MTDELGIDALRKITEICNNHNSCLERADVRYDTFINPTMGRWSVFSHMDIMFSHHKGGEKHFHEIILPELKAQGFTVGTFDIVGKKSSYIARFRLK